MLGTDGKTRCFGGQPGKEFYAEYHDCEWGIPQHEDQKLFEMLILEGAQAGLSWETILKRRAAYRKAFHNFDPVQVSLMEPADLEALCENKEIIRNRLKIFSAQRNAEIFLKIQQEFGSFDRYLWDFVDHVPLRNHWHSFQEIPVSTALSEALSKDLKKRGMKFVGPTIMYAYLQAVGVVNDHTTVCWRYEHV